MIGYHATSESNQAVKVTRVHKVKSKGNDNTSKLKCNASKSNHYARDVNALIASTEMRPREISGRFVLLVAAPGFTFGETRTKSFER